MPQTRLMLDPREAFDELDGLAYDHDDEACLLACLIGHSGGVADDDGLGEEDEYVPDCTWED